MDYRNYAILLQIWAVENTYHDFIDLVMKNSEKRKRLEK